MSDFRLFRRICRSTYGTRRVSHVSTNLDIRSHLGRRGRDCTDHNCNISVLSSVKLIIHNDQPNRYGVRKIHKGTMSTSSLATLGLTDSL